MRIEEPGWNGWWFDGTYLEYRDLYPIDLRTMTDSAHILDWIFQIAPKTWATDDVIAGLVKAIDDLLHPQSNVCSCGVDSKIEPLRVVEFVASIRTA